MAEGGTLSLQLSPPMWHWEYKGGCWVGQILTALTTTAQLMRDCQSFRLIIQSRGSVSGPEPLTRWRHTHTHTHTHTQWRLYSILTGSAECFITAQRFLIYLRGGQPGQKKTERRRFPGQKYGSAKTKTIIKQVRHVQRHQNLLKTRHRQTPLLCKTECWDEINTV